MANEMDVETAFAIERLGERIDALEASLRGEIVDLRGELREGLAQTRHDAERLSRDLREEIRTASRQALVLNESTHEDIRFVADAVAGLTVKIDALRR